MPKPRSQFEDLLNALKHALGLEERQIAPRAEQEEMIEVEPIRATPNEARYNDVVEQLRLADRRRAVRHRLGPGKGLTADGWIYNQEENETDLEPASTAEQRKREAFQKWLRERERERQLESLQRL